MSACVWRDGEEKHALHVQAVSWSALPYWEINEHPGDSLSELLPHLNGKLEIGKAKGSRILQIIPFFLSEKERESALQENRNKRHYVVYSLI